MPLLPVLRNPVGTPVEVGSGLVAGSVPQAQLIGAEALRLFVGNPRGWALPGGDAAVDEAFSCVDEGSYETPMRQVREGLLPVLDALDGDGPQLLPESTAGQGRSLCATVADHEPYLAALDRHPRVGVCFDTCHAFAAGEPLDEPGGTTDTPDPLVLETPGSRDAGDPQPALLEQLRATAIGDAA